MCSITPFFQNDSFSLYETPFEEFEFLVSWHAYTRMNEDPNFYDVLHAQATLRQRDIVVLIDYLGANGDNKTSRFFEGIFKFGKDLNFSIKKIYSTADSAQDQEEQIIVQWCDARQRENIDKLQVSSVLLSTDLKKFK